MTAVARIVMVPAEAHAQLLDYLKDHANTIWMTPLAAVMDHAVGQAGI